jgi:hypothetical protein
MEWLKQTMTTWKKPIQKASKVPTLGEADAKEVVGQTLRFVPPVYENYIDSEEAKFLLAYTKLTQPWSEFLPRFTCPFEAALALLDDRVTLLKHFYNDQDAKFIIENHEQFKNNVGKDAYTVVRAHFQKLEESVDFALAYVTVNLRPIRHPPTNGQGINGGMLLYNRHQERFSTMLKNRSSSE